MISSELRAKQSKGISSPVIYEMVSKIITKYHRDKGILLDVGCGSGKLWSYMTGLFDRYIGIDIIYYEGFPSGQEFIQHNFDSGRIPLEDSVVDISVAIETIEHFENPRAFVRELVRITKPRGIVIVTTPNQLSLLSKLTLIFKNQFNAFQDREGLYPAHITSLLENDLIRIFKECELTDIKIEYSEKGRIPFTPWHWPKRLGLKGRLFSDNIIVVGRRKA